jgi:quinol monooxygenase YgiN
MISVIASVRVKTGKVPEFLEMLKANVPEVREKKGCREYFPAVDVQTDLPMQSLDDHVITIIEKWESLEDLRNHLMSPQMQERLEREKEFVEEVVVKVLQQDA